MHGTASAVAPPKTDAVDANDLLIELAGEHGSVSALRAAILDRAVSGRLIAQGPIGVQQAAGAFPIPAHWQWARGTEIFSFVTSGSRGWAQYYSDKGPIFLRIGNLDYESIQLDLREIQRVRPPAGAEGTRTKVEAGDVLISITGDTGMVGLVREGLGDAYINQHIALARPVSTALPEYLARALTAPAILGAVQRAQRGIKNSLGLEDIRNIALPLPPLAEQKRIVAKVDQLMALCDELETKQAKKRDVGDRLTKAALAALTSAETPEEFKVAWKAISQNFSSVVRSREHVALVRDAILDLGVRGRLSAPQSNDRPVADLVADIAKRQVPARRRSSSGANDEPLSPLFEAPPHWGWVRLDQVADIVGGVTKGRDLRGRKVAAYPYLRVANVQRGSLDLEQMKEIEIPVDELEKYRLKVGDVLFTEGGDWDKVGRSAVWVGAIEPCLHQNHVFRARVLVDGVDPAWLVAVANSPSGRRYFEGAAKQTTNLASINMTQLRACAIPLPSPQEQRRTLAVVARLLSLCDELEERLRQGDALAGRLAAALTAASTASGGLSSERSEGVAS